MSKNQVNKEMEIIDTTIGDLVEAITQIALESGKTEEEGYTLASMAIESLLRRNMNQIAGELLN